MVHVGKRCLKKGDLPFLRYNWMGALIILDNGIYIPLMIRNIQIERPSPPPIPIGGRHIQPQYYGKGDITMQCVLFSFKDEEYKVSLFDVFDKGEAFKMRFKVKVDNGIVWGHGWGWIYRYRPLIGNGTLIGEEVEIVMDAKALTWEIRYEP